MGTPDLIVQMPKPYRLGASGGDVFRNFVIPVDLREANYVHGIELRPGNKRVVHHANIWIDRRQWLRRRDGTDGQPGFPGMDVPTEARSDSFDPDSHFLFWKPGTALKPEPDDMGWQLEPGTDLILNMHLQPSGKEEMIQPQVGFYFTSQRPSRYPMLVQLEHDGALDIPPGAQRWTTLRGKFLSRICANLTTGLTASMKTSKPWSRNFSKENRFSFSDWASIMPA